MPGSGIRDDVAPWSFFLPVTLAVVVGVLAAGWVQRGIDRVFPGDERREAVADAATAEMRAQQAGGHAAAPAQAAAPVTPQPQQDAALTRAADDDASAASVASATADATAAGTPAVPDTAQAGEGHTEPPLPVLPGAIVAIREGAPEACINGSIAVRDVNGWQQRLENDAPVACVERSAAPR